MTIDDFVTILTVSVLPARSGLRHDMANHGFLEREASGIGGTYLEHVTTWRTP
jgi:hypothetical protein